MKKIDAFAHILSENYYSKMLENHPEIEQQYPFVKIPVLVDLDERIKIWPNDDEKQVISFANINSEDYFDEDKAAEITNEANQELANIVE